MVSADGNELHSVRTFEGHRRGVRFAALLGGIGGAEGFPEVLAGLGIDAQQEGIPVGLTVESRIVRGHFLALEDRQVEAAIMQQRAGPVDPHEPQASEVFAEVARPEGLSIEIEGREVARAEECVNPFAIGNG